MATYTAECSKVGSFNYAQYFTLYVVLNDRDGDSSSNKSFVDYDVYCQSSGSGSIKANHQFYFKLNGQVIINENVYVNVSSPKAYIQIANGTIEVEHDNDGNKKIDFEASIVANSYGVSASFSDKFTLNTIPRYLTSISLSNVSQTFNSLSFKWTCSPERDYTQYRIKKSGGSYSDWKDAGDSGTTSGTFVISGLAESTSYVTQIRLRRKDSQLWSESNEVTKSTVSGHTSITKFVVNKVTGRSDQLKITWAAEHACDKWWYSTDNGGSWKDGVSYPDQIVSGLNSGTSYKIKIRVRRKDSQMTTDSRTVTQTTYTQTKFTKNDVNHVSGYSGLSQLKVEWTTNIVIQKLELSLNDGSTWTDKGNPNSSSGSFIITSLSMNTSYKIKLRATSKDGSVIVTTETIKQNTYNKVIGNLYKNGTKLSVTTGIQLTTTDKLDFKDISNPAGCTYKIYFETPDNARRLTQSGTTITASQIQSMFQYLKDKNSQDFNVGIATMNGTTEAHYVDFYGTLVVTNSNPKFNNFTYQDVNSKTLELTGNDQIVIKGYSSIKGIISSNNKAIAQDYATMSKYRFIIGDIQKEANYSSSEEVSLIIPNVNNNVFNMYAIDSRGNSALKTISPSIYKAYNNINIKTAEAQRQNNGIGSSVLLTFCGDIWNNSFGKIQNEITSCIYKYKKTNSNTWITGETNIMPDVKGQSYSKSILIRGDKGAEGFEVNSSYNLQIIIKDKLSTYTYELLVGTGTPGIAISPQGIAFFNMYDENLGGAIQITGDVYVNGKKIN